MTTAIPLDDLQRCFQGIIPAMVATCALDGTPNVTYVSHVYNVDARHVALSRQFLNKTSQNIDANPYAAVQVIDPVSVQMYELQIRFDHAETSGPIFDRMSLRIEAIASHTGMTGVFKLIAADIYEVLDVRHLPEAFVPAPVVVPESEDDGPSSLRTELRVLQVLTQRMGQVGDLEALLKSLLGALDHELRFAHSFVLLLDETGKQLYVVASHGYDDDGGIGAEVTVGQGLLGTVARDRTILSMSDVDGDLRYARAIRREVRSALGGRVLRPEIPLPGLPDARSHIALPLVFRDNLVGVLAVESTESLAFEPWHESFLGVIAGQAAAGIANAMLREDLEGGSTGSAPAPAPYAVPSAPAPASKDVVTGRRKHTFCFYTNDDCVFVDGEYLIRNVPGRLLWKLLRSFTDANRREFTNRELRLDRWLGLPSIRDNLESRLILLRKRLAQKCPDVRMVPTRRGQFRLELECELELVEKDS